MKTIIKIFKKFFKYFKEARKDFLKYSMISFIASLLELLGVALIYPFVLKILSNSTTQEERIESLLIGITIVLIFLIKNIFMIFYINIQAGYTNSFEIMIKEKFMNFFLSANYQDTYRISIAEKNKIFDLLIPNVVNNFILRLLTLNINIFIFLMISLLLAVKFPFATLTTVILAFLIIKLQTRIYKSVLTQVSKDLSESSIPFNQAFNEAVYNIKSIKISGNETYFYNKFVLALTDLYKNLKKQGFYTQIPPFVVEPIVILLLFIMLIIIAFQTYTEPAKLIASFALVASAIFRLSPTIARIQVNLNGLNLALPMVKEVIELLEKYNINQQNEQLTKKNSVPVCNYIELKNIKFCYEPQKYILKGINITIKKGEYIGIAGLSGSGKTTLADIIAGLYKPTSGIICVDGAVLNSPLKVGYIPQELVLTDGTIRENVAFGNSAIDDDRIIEALKKAQLYDFIIKNYTNGIYENPFVDSTGFSQGQKQRLAIARALYSNPDILILDEATSALDLKTEDEICNVLSKLRGEKTIIVIAHRLSTIKTADKIAFIEDGKVSHIAPFDELIRISDNFKSFVEISTKTKN